MCCDASVDSFECVLRSFMELQFNDNGNSNTNKNTLFIMFTFRLKFDIFFNAESCNFISILFPLPKNSIFSHKYKVVTDLKKNKNKSLINQSMQVINILRRKYSPIAYKVYAKNCAARQFCRWNIIGWFTFR